VDGCKEYGVGAFLDDDSTSSYILSAVFIPSSNPRDLCLFR
jgi:hypothetical protein